MTNVVVQVQVQGGASVEVLQDLLAMQQEFINHGDVIIFHLVEV